MKDPAPRRTQSVSGRTTLSKPRCSSLLLCGGLLAAACLLPAQPAQAARLRAGAAKVDVTDRKSGPVNDPLYVRALVLSSDTTAAVIVSVDVVAIGQIGPIRNDYLPRVRGEIQRQLGIPPQHVLINASHCHGRVCSDVAERTVQAVKQAAANRLPVTIGAGRGREDRIMQNRRLRLKNGREADVRHAYSLPPDDQIAGVGPVDPEIGLLRLDRLDGRTLAVLYNFACHPIQGAARGGNTADLTGFACRVIEENLSEGTVALFLQGCAGDINPIWYKDVDHPRDAQPLGTMLGLSALRGLRTIRTKQDGRLTVLNETLKLPRADLSRRIAELEAERTRLVESLRGTSLNLKTFLHLIVKYRLSDQCPSYSADGYLHEQAMGRNRLRRLDAENRQNIQRYMHNVYLMEQLTRLQTNLSLLRKHQARNAAAGEKTIDAEVLALRIGDFTLVTFPGEPTVQIGLNIKRASPHPFTFVAGYTNGYLYYAPTAEQLRNVGGAQEDSECLLAPQWQKLYEQKAAQMLQEL